MVNGRGPDKWRPSGTLRRSCTLEVLVQIGLLSLAVQAAAERLLPTRSLLMGTKSSNLTATVLYNPQPVAGFRSRNVSLHIIVPTIGRTAVTRLLDSLAPQLQIQDHITVVFDAKDLDNTWEDVNAKLAEMPGRHQAIMETENENDWGASIRAKHQPSKTSQFVMHADDDNWYAPDALHTVRTVVQHDLDGLYFFQLRSTAKDGRIVPDLSKNGEVEGGNVDTGCGVIPTRHAHLSQWTDGPKAKRYYADAKYYTALAERVPRIYLVPKIIYIYNKS